MELYLFVAYKSNRISKQRLSARRCEQLVSEVKAEAAFVKYSEGKYNNAILASDSEHFVVCDNHSVYQLHRESGKVTQYLDTNLTLKPSFNVYNWLAFESVDLLFPRDSHPCVFFQKKFLGEIQLVFKGSYNNPISNSLANTSRSVKRLEHRAYFLVLTGELACIDLETLNALCKKGASCFDESFQLHSSAPLTDFDFYVQHKQTIVAGLEANGVVHLLNSAKNKTVSQNISEVLDTQKSVFSTITQMQIEGKTHLLVTSLNKSLLDNTELSTEYQLFRLHGKRLVEASKVKIIVSKQNHIVHNLSVIRPHCRHEIAYVFGIHSCEVFDLLLLSGCTLTPILKSQSISDNCNWSAFVALQAAPGSVNKGRQAIGRKQAQMFIGTMKGIYQITINNL